MFSMSSIFFTQKSKEIKSSVSSEIKIPWPKNPGKHDVKIETQTIEINSSLQETWERVKNIRCYGEYSGDLYNARLEKDSASKSLEPSIGDDIYLKLDNLPSTKAEITEIIDQEHFKMICWSVNFGCLGKTQRVHCLERSLDKDGKEVVLSKIADNLPALVGVPTAYCIGTAQIKKCFDALHIGIKDVAENKKESKIQIMKR
jgi:hypothetical protein